MRLPNTLNYICNKPSLRFQREEGSSAGWFTLVPLQYYTYTKEDIIKFREILDEILKDWRE